LPEAAGRPAATDARGRPRPAAAAAAPPHPRVTAPAHSRPECWLCAFTLAYRAVGKMWAAPGPRQGAHARGAGRRDASGRVRAGCRGARPARPMGVQSIVVAAANRGRAEGPGACGRAKRAAANPGGRGRCPGCPGRGPAASRPPPRRPPPLNPGAAAGARARPPRRGPEAGGLCGAGRSDHRGAPPQIIIDDLSRALRPRPWTCSCPP
jgi:hypothetical protein